jgi:hypothetical protein
MAEAAGPAALALVARQAARRCGRTMRPRGSVDRLA